MLRRLLFFLALAFCVPPASAQLVCASGDSLVVNRDRTGMLCVPKSVIVAPVPTPVPVPTPTPVPTPSTGVSNEPAGFSLLKENSMDCPTVSQNYCNGWYMARDYANGPQLISDNTAPRSAPGVVRQNFTSQLVPGSSPASIGTGIPARKTVYLSMHMLVSTNYIGHGSNVNKVIHFYGARDNRQGPTFGNTGNRAIFTLRGSGSNPLAVSFGIQGIQVPYPSYEGGRTWPLPPICATNPNECGAANLEPNLAPCVAVRGKWHRYEMIVTHNTPGISDGSLEWWQDGTKCARFTGIMFAAAGWGGNWEEVNWSPTYGGGGGTITTSFYTQVDHIYVSGR